MGERSGVTPCVAVADDLRPVVWLFVVVPFVGVFVGQVGFSEIWKVGWCVPCLCAKIIDFIHCIAEAGDGFVRLTAGFEVVMIERQMRIEQDDDGDLRSIEEGDENGFFAIAERVGKE